LRNFLRIKNRISRAIKTLIALSALSLLLCGCVIDDAISDFNKAFGSVLNNQEDANAYETPAENGIAVYDTDGEEITTSESVIDMMEGEDDKENFLSAADLVSSNERLFEDESDEYGYSMLNSDEQAIYKEIYAILTNQQEDVLLSTINTDVIDHSFRCVLMDHPEIFYVTGYSISKYTLGDEIKKITFKGSYTMSSDEIREKQQIVDGYVAECLSGVSQGASDYEKVRYVYEYLINDNTYDLESENNQNILSVCENQVTVCQGYSKMTQLLLNKLGVFCTLVYGTAENATQLSDDGTIYYSDDNEWGSHVWNIVNVDGKYYNLDTTWGDASFRFSDADGEAVDGPDINYDYLLVPDSMILDTHLPSPVVEMPVCDSMDANYYVREGLYFTEVNSSQLKNAFDKAYANGEKYVSIKCSDSGVYEDMRKHLFANEKIFDYLSGTSVRYIEYADRNALSIYL